jgi:hypothetical protein
MQRSENHLRTVELGMTKLLAELHDIHGDKDDAPHHDLDDIIPDSGIRTRMKNVV